MMLGYIIRRLIHSIIVVFGVMVLVFLATHAIGDPVKLLLPDRASNAQIEAMRDSLGLNRPLLIQLASFLGGALRGDFGNSLWQNIPALPLAFSRLPTTLLLAAVTLVFSVAVALLLATWAAARRNTIVDTIIKVISLIGVAMVDFWIAIMLILLFAVVLGWLPTSGYGRIQNIVLPALVLSMQPLGRIAQVVRASLGEELDRPYMTTAIAKGMPLGRRLFIHAFRNASIPIVTLVGSEAIALVNGAVIVETIFGWPGIGQLLIQAIQHRDLPLVEAVVLVVGVCIILINLIVDSTYAFLNPRLRAA
jgi:peptide/nickel transport system permease protein